MTIQPPNDETPPTTTIDTPEDAPDDPPAEPEQRAPGQDQSPMGVPRDEPDPELG